MQRRQIADRINERFSALGDKMIRQTAVVAVKAEYEALGVNVSRLQTNYIVRTGAVMLLITLLSAVSTVWVGYLSAKIAAELIDK